MLGDYGAMAHHLSIYDWTRIFSGCVSINDFWSELYSVLWELVEQYVPMRTKQRSSSGTGGRPRLPKNVRKLVLQFMNG